MKKRFLLTAFFVIMLSVSVLCVEVNKLMMEFESFGQNKSVEIDLEQQFGGDFPFVVSKTQNVDVKINQLRNTATIIPKSADWKGKETIIFATDQSYLEAAEVLEELKEKEVEVTEEGEVIEKPKVVYVNVSEEEVIEALEPLLREGFKEIIKGLMPVKADVKVYKQDKGVLVDLNKEFKINVSFARFVNKPVIAMDASLNMSGLKEPAYEEKNIEFYYLILIILASVALIFLYARFGEKLSGLLFKKKRISHKVELRLERAELKKTFLAKVGSIQRKEGEPRDLYKELIRESEKFFTEFFHIRGVFGAKKVVGGFKKLGVKASLVEEVKDYFKKFTGRAYSIKGVSHVDVRSLTRKLKSIVKKL